MTDLKQLLTDLRAAKEGSKALDKRMALAFGWVRVTPSESRKHGRSHDKRGYWVHPNDTRNVEPVYDSLRGTDCWREPPRFTTSVDDALALVPEETQVIIERYLNGEGAAELIYPGIFNSVSIKSAATPALALSIAILEAKKAAPE